MKWLVFFWAVGAVGSVAAETVNVCYNYGCVAEAQAFFDGEQMALVGAFLRGAQDAEDERGRLSLAIGWMLGWAGQQTPIAADRGGNYADDGALGRMDCIDHSTTTTRLLRLLEARGWLYFHRVLEPAQRVRYLVQMHYSAQIEERLDAFGEGDRSGEPARFVVDSWFRDNGQPAVVLALPEWLDGGGGDEDDGQVAVAVGAPTSDAPVQQEREWRNEQW